MFKNLNLIEMVEILSEKEYDLPILSETYKKCSEMYEKNGLEQDIFEIINIALKDPFLSLKLLFKISHKKRTSIDLEINSIKKTLMMLGFKEFFDIVLSSSVIMEHEGLNIAIKRCQYASEKAKEFAERRSDILPEEVQLTTLLADLGELILWTYKPEIPSKIREEMLYKKYKRNQDAQIALCGFKFKDLSYQLAKKWYLPEPIVELMESVNSSRALISKYCINTSRHIYEKDGYLAIPDDIRDLKKQTNQSILEIYQIMDIKNLLNDKETQHIKNSLHI